MNFLEKIAKALGLEDATEDLVLEALTARPAPLADVAKLLELDDTADAEKVVEAIKELQSKSSGDEKSLEERAKDEGKKVVDQKAYDLLSSQAEAGQKAADELHQAKFDTAFEKALDELRIDAKDETRERFQKLYDAAPEVTIEQLENLPKLAPDAARGSGKGAGEAAPKGVDAERHKLDLAVKAYIKENPDKTYVEALDIVSQEVTV